VVDQVPHLASLGTITYYINLVIEQPPRRFAPPLLARRGNQSL